METSCANLLPVKIKFAQIEAVYKDISKPAARKVVRERSLKKLTNRNIGATQYQYIVQLQALMADCKSAG
jgi:hypothetical protein